MVVTESSSVSSASIFVFIASMSFWMRFMESVMSLTVVASCAWVAAADAKESCANFCEAAMFALVVVSFSSAYFSSLHPTCLL